MSHCSLQKKGNLFQQDLPERGPYTGSVDKVCKDQNTYQRQYASYTSTMPPEDPEAVKRSLANTADNSFSMMGLLKNVFGVPQRGEQRGEREPRELDHGRQFDREREPRRIESTDDREPRRIESTNDREREPPRRLEYANGRERYPIESANDRRPELVNDQSWPEPDFDKEDLEEDLEYQKGSQREPQRSQDGGRRKREKERKRTRSIKKKKSVKKASIRRPLSKTVNKARKRSVVKKSEPKRSRR